MTMAAGFRVKGLAVSGKGRLGPAEGQSKPRIRGRIFVANLWDIVTKSKIRNSNHEIRINNDRNKEMEVLSSFKESGTYLV